MSLTLFRYLYCVIAVVDVSVMDEMFLQWVSYLRQNNVKHKFPSQCEYRQRQWGLRICHCYFKNIKILLCQINFTIYCYDKCQRKNNIRSFPWTVAASQRYPKNKLLQMLWVFCRKTFVKVWFFLKITTQWTGSLEKGNLLFRLLREFSEVREKGKSYSLIS